MEIRIETKDVTAMQALLPGGFKSGEIISLAPGVEARVLPMMVQRSAGSAMAMTFLVSVVGPVALGIVSSAIWDWLKGLRTPPETLVIDRMEIDFEEGEVKRVVTERVEHRRGM
jgi:hypothetical protein